MIAELLRGAVGLLLLVGTPRSGVTADPDWLELAVDVAGAVLGAWLFVTSAQRIAALRRQSR